jgi:hypothetical protein
MTHRIRPAALLLALAGCAADVTRYPSLAPRAVEKAGFVEPVAPVAVATPDAALDSRLAGLAARLDAIAAGFAGAATVAERAAVAARGKPAGSEAWLDAQTALAQLDDWRAQASGLATDVEQVAIERGAALAPDYPALAALAARVDADAARQDQTIARLQAMLAPA